mmetsp:Transcript_11815/g.36499  ORF Transcript_11815/g.36499 Transcript_11815/m.36499 type:complete len:212 (+) Transcript_11815:726-1361(+)
MTIRHSPALSCPSLVRVTRSLSTRILTRNTTSISGKSPRRRTRRMARVVIAMMGRRWFARRRARRKMMRLSGSSASSTSSSFSGLAPSGACRWASLMAKTCLILSPSAMICSIISRGSRLRSPPMTPRLETNATPLRRRMMRNTGGFEPDKLRFYKACCTDGVIFGHHELVRLGQPSAPTRNADSTRLWRRHWPVPASRASIIWDQVVVAF